MTEGEWLYCEDPDQMRRFASEWMSDRKLRLLACAILRRMHCFDVESCAVNAAEVTERFADGEATEEELKAVCAAASARWPHFHTPDSSQARQPLGAMVGGARQVSRQNARKALTEIGFIADIGGVRPRDRASLMREVFGYTGQPPSFDGGWRTSNAVALAQGIYRTGDYLPMPILADCLQDAGCGDEDILNHLRGPGPHVRGCWVIDLILGKA